MLAGPRQTRLRTDAPFHYLPGMQTVWRALVVSSLSLPSIAMPAPTSAPVLVAEGVYAFIETPGEVAAENDGRVGNGGFIVGPNGVTVIDTGVSYRHGRARLDAIRRVTDKPIELVIVTHAMQEFLFGNAAFEEIGARFLTHAKSADLMRQRCDHCLDNLRLILGQEAMKGTRLIVPEQVLEGSAAVLESGGRALELIHPEWAATPGDLMVLDRATGVLFAGGVVVQDRIPELRDGQLRGWIDAITMIRRLAPSAVVPGHGPLISADDAQRTADYLSALDARVRELYLKGTSLLDAVEQAALPGFEDWAGYGTIHRRNALNHYLELEIEELNR